MKAVLICNIGTPEACDESSVKNYLDEFLMDKDVISLPWLIRYPLVRWLITPRRSKASAKKYQAVWTERGSPLLVYTEDLVQQLAKALPSNVIVRTAMRYSQPSLRSVLEELTKLGVKEINVVPMFPQFAQATTGSLIKTFESLKKEFQFTFRYIEAFYSEDFFINSFVDILRKSSMEYDHLLFSYHGLPQSQVKKISPTCLTLPNCCALPGACEKNCYRAQCVRTTEMIAQKLQLPKNKYSISFQSRLGPVKWITPYTDDVIKDLAASGIKKLAVVCPSFVTDCIETLEEIGIEGREVFHHSGGERFDLIPCLNADEFWVRQFASYLQNYLKLNEGSARQSVNAAPLP